MVVFIAKDEYVAGVRVAMNESAVEWMAMNNSMSVLLSNERLPFPFYIFFPLTLFYRLYYPPTSLLTRA